MTAAPAPLQSRIVSVPRIFDAAAAARLKDGLGERFQALSGTAQGLALGVGGSSPFLSRLIARAPDAFVAALAEAPEARFRSIADAARRTGDLGGQHETQSALRRVKGQAALVAGLAEIAGAWTSLDAGAALSGFADAAADAALRAALRSLAEKGFAGAETAECERNSGVAIIAMGKLGARELNYSSDIDLIVLFDPSAPALGDPLTAREVAVSAARRLVRILNEQTPDGYVFRTDIRLRPDPGVSAAAVSVQAAESYYEAHGQNWERAAFIKARAAAGDIAVGEKFLKNLRPFIWRKYLDFAAIEDIHSIKRQIHAAKGGGKIEFYGHDIKTGRGGIREIEFLAQTQQLILGGKNPALRPRATIDALAALKEAGQLSEETLKRLTANYLYLRRVEHHLQMINDEQTHRTPRDESGAERLAAFLAEDSAAALETRLIDVLKSTHGLFTDLFEREERLSAGVGSLVFTGVENDASTLETLSKLGFQRPADVSETIRRWHTGTLRATRSARARELLTKLAPKLLEALSGAHDPDAAFVAFSAFLGRLPGGVQVFSLFANNPDVFDMLIRIMTISPYLGAQLARRTNLIEALLERDWPASVTPPDELEAELLDELRAIESYEQKLNTARRWGAEQRFNIAAQLIIGGIDPPTAAERFTAVADAAVKSLLPVALAEIERTHGAIDGALAVVGMGRLGAGAMTASSDVDLVFVYDAPADAVSSGPKPLDAQTYFLRVVRRFLTTLSAVTEEGGLYEVDMQLRPSGSKGPWAVSIAAFERYYEGEAWTWEEMALTKARIVAGDADLAGRMRAALTAVRARPREEKKIARDVHEMRNRLLEAKPPAGPWDVKLAEGGLTEIEFAVAFIVLTKAAALCEPPPGVSESLRFLAEKGAIDADDATGLLTALELFESVLQIGRAATGEVFSPNEGGAAMNSRMASACGRRTIGEAEALLCERQREVKRIYDKIVVSSAGVSKEQADEPH